jgi:hypothetical protein
MIKTKEELAFEAKEVYKASLALSLKQLAEREKAKNNKKTEFFLYLGDSPDGRGDGYYIGKTKSKRKALKHFRYLKESPYRTGSVQYFSKKKHCFIYKETDFENIED